MSKKGGKDGGGQMDKEKEVGKLYKELAALRCHCRWVQYVLFCGCQFSTMFLFRPTEDFDPEQEDWEKAVKVS